MKREGNQGSSRTGTYCAAAARAWLRPAASNAPCRQRRSHGFSRRVRANAVRARRRRAPACSFCLMNILEDIRGAHRECTKGKALRRHYGAHWLWLSRIAGTCRDFRAFAQDPENIPCKFEMVWSFGGDDEWDQGDERHKPRTRKPAQTARRASACARAPPPSRPARSARPWRHPPLS